MRDSWNSGELREFVEKIIGGGTPSKKIESYWEGNIPWASVKDFEDNNFSLEDTQDFISKYGLRNSSASLIPPGIPIMCTRMAVGRVAVSPVSVAINQDLKAFYPNNELDLSFFLVLLWFLKGQFEAKAVGSTVKGISLKDINLIPVQFPKSLPQQKKIARILSTCDEVIEKTEVAISKYQALKQGMMHDLFTRGLDLKTGKLRPTFEVAPELYKKSELGMISKEWEDSQFIEFANERISHSFTGGPFGSDLQTKHYTKDGIRIIQLQNIGDGYFKNKYKIFTSEERANHLRACNIFPGDIILSKMADPIARACIIPNFQDRYLMASDGIRLSIDKKKFNLRFVLETINQRRFRNFAELRATGTTRSRIGLTELKEIPVCYPEIREQNLIGEKLEVIENKISIEQSTLSKYQQLKSGLMQDLLTGRVEVNVAEEEFKT